MVAILRRGPTDWWHVGRWDVAGGAYEPGAWFRGALYPQKSDLSPDGRWLAYSALKPGGNWPGKDIYEAVSRLPWLEALAAWNVGTTYTRGFHFDASAPGECDLGTPDVGNVEPCLKTLGLKLNRAEQFSVERRRGWEESAGTPPREAGDLWDERRPVEMEKRQPGDSGRFVLHVEGSYAGHRSSPQMREPATYFLTDAGGALQVLDEVQWADWDRTGRLLVATTAGVLQVRVGTGDRWDVVSSVDLAGIRPDPQSAPEWAGRW